VAWDLHRRIPSSRFTELHGRGHYFLYERKEMEDLLVALSEAHRVCAADKKRVPRA
jgi:hypothetical protein